MKKKRVLFYCKHNSCRSQMAEAYLKYFAGDEYKVFSSGLSPNPIHPLVEVVMEEEGISLKGHTSKAIENYLGKQPFDYVFIVCRDGEAECPSLYPFALNMDRWPLADPGEVTGDEQKVLQAFRNTRDDIKRRIKNWLDSQAMDK